MCGGRTGQLHGKLESIIDSVMCVEQCGVERKGVVREGGGGPSPARHISHYLPITAPTDQAYLSPDDSPMPMSHFKFLLKRETINVI